MNYLALITTVCFWHQIMVQRTEQNSPVGLEVQLHITEAVCPALSERGAWWLIYSPQLSFHIVVYWIKIWNFEQVYELFSCSWHDCVFAWTEEMLTQRLNRYYAIFPTFFISIIIFFCKSIEDDFIVWNNDLCFSLWHIIVNLGSVVQKQQDVHWFLLL